MNRRTFSRSLAALASGLVLGKDVLAEETCVPVAPYISRCTAGIPTLRLNGITAYQQQSEWCWAACIQMVFAFYGHRVPQRRIVKETWGEIVDMPGQPEQILADLNRSWMDEDDKKFASSADSLSANAATA